MAAGPAAIPGGGRRGTLDANYWHASRAAVVPEAMHATAGVTVALLEPVVLVPYLPAQAKALVADPGVSGRRHSRDLVTALAAEGAAH
jgi:hypothetical protein